MSQTHELVFQPDAHPRVRIGDVTAWIRGE